MARRRGPVYWGAIVLDTFEQLLAARLNGNELRVFLYLCSNMNHQDNICGIIQQSISDKLEIHKTSVSKAIKTLSDKQFIIKTSSPKGFMINPHLFYVSKIRPYDREELRADFDERLRARHFEPRFSLNEDENKLEVLDEL